MNKDAVAEMSQQYQVETAQQLVPEGYKQTEVGVIPVDWIVVPFGDLYEESIPRKRLKPNDLVTFIGMQDVSESAQLIGQHHIVYEQVRSGFTYFERGDVLVAKITPCFENGKGCHTETMATEVGFGSTEFHVLRAKNSSNSEFIYYWTVRESFRNSLELEMVGSAGHRRVPSSALQNYLIPSPSSVKEQTAIARALSDTDALLSELEKLIAKKQAIKTATMQQLLTGRTRLPQFAHHPDGSKKGYKQSELGEIPEDWEVVEFSAVVEKIVGGGTPSRSNPAYWGNDIPWVTVKDFATFSPFTAQEKITKLGLQNSSSNLISSGTLITSTRMALGKAVIYKVDVAINQDLKAIFTSRNLETSFLCFWFENNAQKIEELGSGSTVKGLSLTDLRKIPFLLQSMEEQAAIATILADMDEEIQALEHRLTKTRQIKQGMMQELLTGKTRLIKGGKNV